VTTAYWDLVDTNQQYGVAESFLRLGNEQLSQNRRRLEAGVGTEVEVIQAEADVATRTETLLLQDVNVRAAMDALKALLFPGTEEDLWNMELVPATPLPEPSAVTPDAAPPWFECLMTALDNRSILRQQRMEIETAELAYSQAASQRMIGLDLELSTAANATDGDSSEALTSIARYEYPTYTAALVLNTPIGNRAAKYAERAAWADVRRQKLTYDSLEIAITSEVRDAVRQVVYQAERVRAAGKSLELAQRQLDAEQARYREGLSTNFQVLEFQQDLATAESTEKRARVDYMKALATLEAVRGIIGEDPDR
jgi:outer membrane protein TolC